MHGCSPRCATIARRMIRLGLFARKFSCRNKLEPNLTQQKPDALHIRDSGEHQSIMVLLCEKVLLGACLCEVFYVFKECKFKPVKSWIVGVRKFFSVWVFLVDVLLAITHIHKHKPLLMDSTVGLTLVNFWVTGVSCLVFHVAEGSCYAAGENTCIAV